MVHARALGLAVLLSAVVSVPRPTWGAPTSGKRSIAFVLEADSGRVVLGPLEDRLPTVTLTATAAEAGGVLISPRLEVSRPPTRWRLHVEHTNRRGVVVGRELPVVGEGLPPVAIWIADPPPALHLRATLELELGRFDGATSAPVWLPLLPEAPPQAPEQRTLSIDGRVARLSPGRQVLTLELDAPATVTLRIDDVRGSRWLRRGVSMGDVRRPGTERTARVVLDDGQLWVGSRVLALPAAVRVLRAAGDLGAAWAELGAPVERPTAWRATWGVGGEIVAEHVGLGAPPTRLAARPWRAAEWFEVELSTPTGWWVTTGQLAVPTDGLGAPAIAHVLVAPPGELVRVGTATGARAHLAL